MIAVAELADLSLAAPVLRELRGALDDATFARRLAAARTQGYRVLAAWDGAAMVGALGCRLIEDLCWGRSLFIDDLVVTETRRGQRIGDALMAAAERLAAEAGCDHLRLCSGHARTDAHRFYQARGIEPRSLHFATPVARG